MDRIQISALNQFMAQAETLGLKLPKAVGEGHARMEKVAKGIESIPAHNLTGVASAVADALSRDADPTTDPEVLRAIAHSVITGTGIAVNVEAASYSQLRDLYEQFQDEIVDELRKPFDLAAAALVLAHERIGDLDLKDDSKAILAKGGDIAKVWATAVEASKAIENVVLAWVSLGQFIKEELLDRRWLNLRLVNPSAEIFDANDWSRVAVTPWGAVRAGVELSLPTRSEYVERRAAITNQRAELEAESRREPKRRPI
ncbi:MAG: hypothetical protein Q7R42_06030 [Candidatus Planktophila sp.]|nr:hypothetical protein [Candidatus Planktophila sp.]